MKERPILFRSELVHAILAGKKTQTRRIVRPCIQLKDWGATPGDAYDVTPGAEPGTFAFLVAGDHGYTDAVCCPYGKPGDLLWVRETWLELDPRHRPPRYAYRADQKPGDSESEQIRKEYIRCGYPYRWRPSIHMPRSACRLTLELTDVRVQRLQEITLAEAEAEGFTPCGITGCTCHLDILRRTWGVIHGKDSWQSNPWVWALTFRGKPVACEVSR